MSEHTAISWCDSTFNPWIGCTKVSPACDNCYAERLMDHRLHRVQWDAGKPRMRTSAENWRQPLRWNAQQFVQCAACGHRCELREFHAVDGPADFTMCPACSGADWHGTRRRVFCSSLADVFDNEVDESWRLDLFGLILKTPHLDWLVLTKRIGNVRSMLAPIMSALDPSGMHPFPLPNVWLGATICNQEEADRDISKLLATPAAVRFLSIEPMLGDIRLGSWLQRSPSAAFEAGLVTQSMPAWTRIGSSCIDWVICGGESGPHARPMHPDWVRSLRDECAAAAVPFHFKQWGEWIPYEHSAQPPFLRSQHGRELDGHALPDFESEDGRAQREWYCDFADQLLARRVGTKTAGRLLDGITHSGWPA